MQILCKETVRGQISVGELQPIQSVNLNNMYRMFSFRRFTFAPTIGTRVRVLIEIFMAPVSSYSTLQMTKDTHSDTFIINIIRITHF